MLSENRGESPQVWIARLQTALNAPLPGAAAQRKMAPQPRSLHAPAGSPPRPAAVLLLLTPLADGEVALLFTRRTLTVAHHKGQICFPGGRRDAADASVMQTALRETEEEIGVPPTEIVILGQLTPLYVRASDHLIHPVVGWIPRLPALSPNPAEVAQVLLFPVRALLDPQTVSTCTYSSGEQSVTAPCYTVEGHAIWGATAMMTSELLEIIRRDYASQTLPIRS